MPHPHPPGPFPHPEGRGVSPFDNVDFRKLVFVDEDGAIRRERLKSQNDDIYGIEIPANITALKQHDIERAKRWQLYLREAMTDLLAAGYVVSGFVRSGDSGWYTLSREW